MIRNLLSFRRNAVPVVVTPIPAPAARSKTILMIDDHPDSLRAMCMALAGETYRVETADTAKSAIHRVCAYVPDLIIIDPRVLTADGTALAQRLLADEALAAIPIVALTETVAGPRSVREPGGGFDGYIQKPVDAGTFAALVRGFSQPPVDEWTSPAIELDLPAAVGVGRRIEAAKLLDAIETGLPGSQFAPGVGTALHRIAGVVGGLQHGELAGYLERAERLSNASTVRARGRFRSIVRLCLQLVEQDPDSAPELADLRAGYLQRRRAELSGLEQALHEGDFAAIRKAGHNLKGTGAAYGYAEITDIGRSLEAAAKEGDAVAVEALLDQMDSYIGIVCPSRGTGEIDAAGS
jgi:CheY-like chemotaxis protein/HPt (histidine-containing phosphotransfer) domain-containing protein